MKKEGRKAFFSFQLFLQLSVWFFLLFSSPHSLVVGVWFIIWVRGLEKRKVFKQEGPQKQLRKAKALTRYTTFFRLEGPDQGHTKTPTRGDEYRWLKLLLIDLE